jgi:hypothetical protein
MVDIWHSSVKAQTFDGVLFAPSWTALAFLDRRNVHIFRSIPNEIPRKLEAWTSVF